MGTFITLALLGSGVLIGAASVYTLMRKKAFLHPPISLESLGVAYFRRNFMTGREEYSNPLRQMLSLTSTDRGFFSNLPPQQTQALEQAMEEAKSGKTSVVIIMHIEEGRKQIECTIHCLRDKQNNPDQLIALFRDVTAQEKHQRRVGIENEQLKRDAKQFSSLLNAMPMPIWMRTDELTIRYCNLAYSEVAEESPERKSGQETLELHSHARALAQAAHEEGAAKSERRHLIVGGARRLYQFTEIPLIGSNIIAGVAQDVTELEVAGEELQRHIHAQSDLLESVTSAMVVFGPDQRLKFFNYAYVHLWGVEEAWLEHQPTYGELLEMLREKRRLPEQANFPQFKQRHLKLFTDLIEPQEEIFHLPDGRTLRVLAIPHALGGILFAYEDVTDRLALERSYNTLIAVQRATLDNLHEGVVVFGEDGRLRLYNPKFLQLWKLEKAVLSAQTHISDLVEKTRALHAAENWEQYKQGFIAQLLAREVRHKRLERMDNSVIDLVSVPLPDGATLITFSDVTDSTVVERSLRERNDALQDADRLKTQFLANVSYELRSPLTSISGFSEMLAQDYFGKLSARQREYVGAIHEASQHLMRLIDDILDVASVEAGYMRLNITEFDIHAMLQTVELLVHERIAERKLHFILNCMPHIGHLLADETRVKQILFNLLSNAIKYSEEGGNVTLTASIDNHESLSQEEIIFMVEDNGAGIPPEEQEAVFSKFYKSEVGSRRPGAGLGLSMAKSFVEMHGGHITLTSTLGQGTRVECRFPRRNSYLLLEKTMNDKLAS